MFKLNQNYSITAKQILLKMQTLLCNYYRFWPKKWRISNFYFFICYTIILQSFAKWLFWLVV